MSSLTRKIAHPPLFRFGGISVDFASVMVYEYY